MPQSIFNPYPRNMFNYTEVKEAWRQYEQVVQALAHHCAPGRLRVSGGAEAHDHLIHYLTLVREMQSSAFNLVEKCNWVLDRHLGWLEQVITETQCTQRQETIELAMFRLTDVRERYTRMRQRMEVNCEKFGRWATVMDARLEKLRDYMVESVYAFEEYRVYFGGFTGSLERFRRECIRGLEDED